MDMGGVYHHLWRSHKKKVVRRHFVPTTNCPTSIFRATNCPRRQNVPFSPHATNCPSDKMSHWCPHKKRYFTGIFWATNCPRWQNVPLPPRRQNVPLMILLKNHCFTGIFRATNCPKVTKCPTFSPATKCPNLCTYAHESYGKLLGHFVTSEKGYWENLSQLKKASLGHI